MNAVFLVGFMGAGKTSVGRALAERINWVFEDLDDRIERLERRPIAEIFRDSGETVFRQAERKALLYVLRELAGGIPRIIALGGGAFVQTANAELLKAAGLPTVFLDASVEELWRRCSEQASQAGTERPLLRSSDQFRDLYQRRLDGYRAAAIRIETGNRTVEEIAAEIAEALRLKAIAIRSEEGEGE